METYPTNDNDERSRHDEALESSSGLGLESNFGPVGHAPSRQPGPGLESNSGTVGNAQSRQHGLESDPASLADAMAAITADEIKDDRSNGSGGDDVSHVDANNLDSGVYDVCESIVRLIQY